MSGPSTSFMERDVKGYDSYDNTDDYYYPFITVPDPPVPILSSTIVGEHTARIFSLALCTLNDSTKVAASASHDRTVKIWSLSTLKEIRTFTYSDFVWRVFLVTSASTGRVCVIAFISAEDKIYVSDLKTGELLHCVHGRLVFAGVIRMYTSPVIVALVNEADLVIVDAETGKIARKIFGGFLKAFRAIASFDNLPVLVFNTWNAQNRRSSIQAYDLSIEPSTRSTGDKIQNVNLPTYVFSEHQYDPEKMKVIFEGDSKDGITSVAISQGTKPVICSGHYDNVVRVWDLVSYELLLVLQGHTDWVVSVTVWKGPEPICVSGSSDGTIKIWNFRSGNLICTCEGHQRDVWAVTVTTGPKNLIVSASSDRSVRTWDVNPVLQDIKWERRKHFCLFLVGCKFMSVTSSNTLISSVDADRRRSQVTDSDGGNLFSSSAEFASRYSTLAVGPSPSTRECKSLTLVFVCEHLCSSVASYL